jgi:hypothetical protein
VSTPVAQRFWGKVDTSQPANCWIWTGAKSTNGYGKFGLEPSLSTYAHRVAYLLTFGRIADGLEVDHICRRRLCVNPWHLETVTHAENMQRSFDARPTCKRGHRYTGERTTGNRRRCRLCEQVRDRKRRGKGSPLEWFVTMDGDTWLRILDALARFDREQGAA